MYHILTSKVENDREDAILSGDSVYLKRIETVFREGVSVPVEDILTPIVFKIEQFALRGTMTDHLSLNDIPGPVISVKAKTVLEKAGIGNIQYLQLTLLDEFPEGEKKEDKKDKKKIFKEYKDFYVANIVGLVDCIDHKNSVLEYFYPAEIREQNHEDANEINNPFVGENLNHIDMITKLVIDETRTDPSLKIFRLMDQPNLLVFHESVVAAIRKEGLRGFVFVSIEEYTDIIPDEIIEEAEKEEVVEKKSISQATPITSPKPTPKPPKEEPQQPKPNKFGFSID